MPEWVTIVIRSMVSIVAVFIFTKMIGKRQLSQMTFFEYTVGIAIGDMAAIIADDVNGPMYKGLLAMSIYALFPILLGWLALKSKIIRNFVEGKGRVLIKNGKVMEENLKKERISTDELLEQLRLKSAFKVADVEFALMETNGQVSVLLKAENQPITPKKMNWQVAPEKEPQAVIMDGTIMDESLATLGMNRRWLKSELDMQGIALENVFLAQVDSNGEMSVDLYDDKLQVPSPQPRPLVYATLKKCQADFELYALSTQNEQAKLLYETGAQQLQEILDELTPYLMR
ncbi:DUF421 domain-containing protein [Tumebacillus sp. ITR2]|uniref:DUF421 domain-containing protein n=1 Tax=Tumebacillus amylolyticus TaxID=2801339 RepID=A0ABS1J8V6_9BACL|nr:DUF421 domain-containing protein [Tumebacillus amylolyticus]MBL0386696.1 DUF421 domain-containing protein [Tumebacillus amylolyticus]